AKDDQREEDDDDADGDLDRRQPRHRGDRIIGSVAERREEVAALAQVRAARDLARWALADPAAVFDHGRIIPPDARHGRYLFVLGPDRDLVVDSAGSLRPQLIFEGS